MLYVQTFSGNTNLHILSTVRPQELRVDLMKMDNDTAYVLYGVFQVASEEGLFRLTVGQYSGTPTVGMYQVAQWVEHRISNSKVPGSTAGSTLRKDTP